MTFNILSFSLFHTQLGVVHKINIPPVNYIRSTVHSTECAKHLQLRRLIILVLPNSIE